jgi:hypothetical protein
MYQSIDKPFCAYTAYYAQYSPRALMPLKYQVAIKNSFDLWRIYETWWAFGNNEEL